MLTGFKKKMDIPKAFKAAQSSMNKKYNETLKWAGFVLMEQGKR